MKQTTICQHCGKEFEIYTSRIKRGNGKFCSRSCGAKSRAGERNPRYKPEKKRIYICETCGKEFEIKRGCKGRFCSIACRGVWQSKSVVGEAHPAFKRIECICAACGKVFLRKPHDAIDALTCSRQCQNRYQSEFLRRENRKCEYCNQEFWPKKTEQRFCSLECKHTWLGQRLSIPGSTFPYPSTFNRPFRRMIRERDNYTCAICGEWGNTVHHINYIKADTYPENCITLCGSCHSKTNTNRIYWQARFASLMEMP